MTLKSLCIYRYVVCSMYIGSARIRRPLPDHQARLQMGTRVVCTTSVSILGFVHDDHIQKTSCIDFVQDEANKRAKY